MCNLKTVTPFLTGFLSLFFSGFLPAVASSNLHNYVLIDKRLPAPTLTSVLSDFNGFNVRCNGESNGFIDLTVTGDGPFSFQWSTGEISEDLNALPSGIYTVTVTDNNGLTASETYTLTEPAPISLQSTLIQNVTCFGFTDGSIDKTISGGVIPYTFLWSNGNGNEDLVNVASGFYTLFLTDLNGCTQLFLEDTVTQPDSISVQATIQNASCGNANGSVTLTVSGGSGFYSYLWSNGVLSKDISALTGNVYTVTITDGNACTKVETFIVGSNPSPVINIDSVQTVRCHGNNNGSVFISTVGASINSYQWSNGSIGMNLLNVGAATYTVTVTDINNCTATNFAVVTQPPMLSENLISKTNVSCNGGTNGAMSVVGIGGTGTYQYSWSSGQNTAAISGLTAGNYTVTITDANNCTHSASFNISQPPPINLSLQLQNATCGLNNGSISTNCSGGFGGFSFLWNTGSTLSSISNCAPGTYTVTVTDQNLCTKSNSVLLTALAPPVLAVDSVKNVRCFNGNTGGIFISITGGSGILTYQWSNGSILQNLTNVGIGTYTVTVTDSANCTTSATRTIIQPADLVLSFASTASACGQNNGTATVTPSGGTAPYSFLWNNGQTFSTATGLAPGTYTVTITDANLCTKSGSRIVSTVNAPVMVVDSIKNVKCFNNSNGAIYISVTGGSGNKTYLWSNGSTQQNLINVSAGTYTVTVTDSANCSVSDFRTITQPTATLSANITAVNGTCGQNNASISTVPAGGTSPYFYLWNTAQTTASISNLAAGSYTVTVSDNNGCSVVQTSSVSSLSPPSIMLDTVINVTCYSLTNGAIFTHVTGGAGTITYTWTPAQPGTDSIYNLAAGNYQLVVLDTSGCTDTLFTTVTSPDSLTLTGTVIPERCGINNGSASITKTGGTGSYSFLWSTNATSSIITNLSTGNYTATVTDANGCSASLSLFVDSLGSPVINDSVVNVKCFGGATGAIYTNVTGNGPLTYLWSPGGFNTVNLLNLTIGNYTLTVTDTNACSNTKSYSITQPTGLTTSVSSTPAGCTNTGTATVIPNGGTPPYSYVWIPFGNTATITNLPGGWAFVTVTDSNNCQKTDSVFINTISSLNISTLSIIKIKCFNDSTGAIFTTTTGGVPPFSYQWNTPLGTNSPNITNIPAGIYSVVVTDSNSCTATLTDTLVNPALLQLTSSSTPATCNLNNGSVSVLVSGGAIPYHYQWSTAPADTNFTVSGLTNGLYTVTITDANGCIKSDTVTLIRITPPTGIAIPTNVSCNGLSDGSISVTTSGGIAPYQFLWSYNGITTQNLTNVPAGNYTVTITDTSGCTYEILDIQISENPPLNAGITSTPTGCSVNSTGTATVTASGGTGAGTYTYLWTPGNFNTATISGLSAQTYTVTVTDSNQCSTQSSVVIGTSSSPVITQQSYQDVNCYGDSSGFINISVSGGTAPFSFQWNNGALTQNIANLIAGNYSLTVTDSNQCTATYSKTIIQNSRILPNLTLVNAPCNGAATGSITSNPSGGAGSYQFQWSGGSASNTETGSAGSTHTVTITDALGCKVDTTVTINVTSGPQINSVSTTNVNCFGDSTGTAQPVISGGTLPYTYLWIGTSPVQTTANAINLQATNYLFVVTDTNGCKDSAAVTITNNYPAINILFSSTPSTCSASNGQVLATVSGGSGGYQFLWNNSTSANPLVNLSAGSYTLTITDSVGCKKSSIATVSNISGPIISIIDSANVSCFGANDGFIIPSVTGGTPNYQYVWQDGITSLSRLNLNPNTYILTVTDANNCVSVRSVTITQPPAIFISSVIPVKNGLYNITCNGLNDGEITLNVSGGTPFSGSNSYTYLWSVSGATGPTVLQLTAGNYNVTVADSLGCSKTAAFQLTEPPALDAGEGYTQSICGIDTIQLTATAPNYGIGKWIVKTGTGIFSQQDSIITNVNQIANGINIYAWVVSDNFCSDSSFVIINKRENIFSDAGIDQNICTNSVFLSAVPPASGIGQWTTLAGTGTIANIYLPNSEVSNLTSGLNIFEWTIQNGNCISKDTVRILILPPNECLTDVVMPTGFTPNGDGFNDFFVIRGIDFNDNNLTIFNRWGNVVYDQKNYQNNWDGKSNNKMELPDGTYYAVFKIPSRNLILKSYVDLRR